jgi:cytidine deaminase
MDGSIVAGEVVMDALGELFAAAQAAQANAYAPYSRFKVGAAVRTVRGRIYTGCNVENAALPNGICAETAALAAMVAAGERALETVLIFGEGAALVTPCGGCRQRIREFAGPLLQIHIAGPSGLQQCFCLDELLPYSFGPDHLARKSESSEA